MAELSLEGFYREVLRRAVSTAQAPRWMVDCKPIVVQRGIWRMIGGPHLDRPEGVEPEMLEEINRALGSMDPQDISVPTALVIVWVGARGHARPEDRSIQLDNVGMPL